MKPGAILINTSRGPLLDEAALVAAVQAGRIAALDVTDRSPCRKSIRCGPPAIRCSRLTSAMGSRRRGATSKSVTPYNGQDSTVPYRDRRATSVVPTDGGYGVRFRFPISATVFLLSPTSRPIRL